MAFQLETTVLGIDPLAVIEDAYNAIDDYIADATDAFENALTGAAEVISGETSSVSAKRGIAAGSHIATEIRDGCDELHHALRSIMDRNFDKFELYALKNVTKVPEALAKQLEAAQAPPPLPSYSEFTATEAEEQRLRASVESLQTQILQQRARRRALLGLKRHAESKLPQCEEAINQVVSMIDAYQHSSSDGMAAAVDEVVHGSIRLEASVAQLRSMFSV